ncbi:uncharacterized protein LOC119079011 [Bradysia coprophila]|uniref:uncharacterized protein LOC119079011 n=1 Tax=Bradysia coprophila TaxID=38358 RepID=UPI00187DC5E3|nr:uncharacterized protein LOC119079011 [Bradysia coprophila]
MDIDVVEQNNELVVNEDELKSSKEQILPHRKRKYNEAEWNNCESDLLQAQQNNITQNAQQYDLPQPVAKIEQKHRLAQQVMKQRKKKEVKHPINSRRSLRLKCKKVRGDLPVKKGNSLPRRSKRNARNATSARAVESNMVHQCNVCNKTYRKSGFLSLHYRRCHPQIISTKTPEVARKGDKK